MAAVDLVATAVPLVFAVFGLLSSDIARKVVSSIRHPGKRDYIVRLPGETEAITLEGSSSGLNVQEVLQQLLSRSAIDETPESGGESRPAGGPIGDGRE